MRRKELHAFQRPLFPETPQWKQFPTEVGQQVVHLLAHLAWQIVNESPSHEPPLDHQEQPDEPGKN